MAAATGPAYAGDRSSIAALLEEKRIAAATKNAVSDARTFPRLLELGPQPHPELPQAGGLDEFPAPARHRVDLNPAEHSDSAWASVLSNDGHGIRDQTPLQQFARRVRREGLPVLRLWQNHAALLSLGFNNRGKPGLWIVQKTP
jgi:hypothetical protein